MEDNLITAPILSPALQSYLKSSTQNEQKPPAQLPDTFEKEQNVAPEIPKTPESQKPVVDKKIVSVVLATTLLGVGATYALTRGNTKVLKNIIKGKDEAIEALQSTAQDTVAKVTEEAGKKIADLQDLLDGKLSDKYKNELEEKLQKFTLDYDPTNPPREEVKKNTWDILLEFLPLKRPASKNIQALNIPEFSGDQKFDFRLPKTSAVKPSNYTRTAIKAESKIPTTITMDYADSVQWGTDKIARDLLQNFYDGHGQTLDGVRLVFEPLGKGKYKVRIEGEGLYESAKAILLGDSSKRGDLMAAGNYGEGLKMTVLKILKDSGADEVRIGSDNWLLRYTPQQFSSSDKKVLAYSLDEVQNAFKGNFVEFETTDMDLVSSLRKGLNSFYHSSNKDFDSVDFENALFGIKTLPEGHKGGVYIAGQKFEFDGNWDGLDGATIFFKQKPPAQVKYFEFSNSTETVFDPSRDRISLNSENLEKISKYFVFNKQTTNEEALQALLSLEKYWAASDTKTPLAKAVEGMVDGAARKNIQVDFPQEYIAMTRNTSNDLIDELIDKGYKPCKASFSNIGMQTIEDFMKNTRNHSVLSPDATEIKKIGLIREALDVMSGNLKNEKFFEETELKPKIFLFNAASTKETELTKDTLAEAILAKNPKTYSKTSQGFWIDRKYLQNVSFEEALTTTLHELTHKSGGDGSAEFSYKLTDVLGKVIETGVQDPVALEKLKAIKKAWETLSTLAPAA